MDLNEAFRTAIKTYFEEDYTPEELNTTSKKKIKYNKKFFDNLGEDFGVSKKGLHE